MDTISNLALGFRSFDDHRDTRSLPVWSDRRNAYRGPARHRFYGRSMPMPLTFYLEPSQALIMLSAFIMALSMATPLPQFF